MKCYSIIDGKVHPHIDMSGFRWCGNFKDSTKVATAALQLYVDSAWESKDILNGLRFHNNPESLLYGIAYLSDGNTESDIIPKNTIALSVPVVGYTAVSGTDDWSMPITFNADRKIMLCFSGNTFLTAENDKYIINKDGKPVIVDSVERAVEPTDGTIWEF